MLIKRSDFDVRIAKNELLKMTNEELEATLSLLVAEYKQYFDRFDWPAPTCSMSLAETREKVRLSATKMTTEGRYGGTSKAGNQYLKSRFMSYWAADTGPFYTCKDEKTLEKVLRYRVGLNSNRETFDISLSEIRRGFVVGRHVVSFFKPAVAAAVYKNWIKPGTVNPVVWDPSGGFGARMLGLFSMFDQAVYITNEPAFWTKQDLRSLACDIQESLGQQAEIVVLHKGSEHAAADISDLVEKKGKLDLVFTSPPYFKTERYFDEPGQCWREYPEESTWIEKYVKPTLTIAYDNLKDGAFLVINVSNKLESIFADSAKACNFVLHKRETLSLGADHFSQRSNHDEVILIFRKDTENWCCLPTEEQKYEVSSLGRVRNRENGKVLKGNILSSGYCAVGLSSSETGKVKTHLVHRLVALTFFGPPPSADHSDVRHLNGQKTDNRLENLAWGTRSENMLDVVKHRAQKKEQADTVDKQEKETTWYGGRTSDTALVEVCLKIHQENKITTVDVARLLDCSESVAFNIVRGRTHNHIQIEREETKKKRTPLKKKQIVDLITSGKTREEVNSLLQEELTAQEFYYYKCKSKAAMA